MSKEKKILEIEISCGRTTCATEPGKFCRFTGTARFGTITVCSLFPSDKHSYTELKDVDGWIIRCEDCMNGEKNGEKILEVEEEGY